MVAESKVADALECVCMVLIYALALGVCAVASFDILSRSKDWKEVEQAAHIGAFVFALIFGIYCGWREVYGVPNRMNVFNWLLGIQAITSLLHVGFLPIAVSMIFVAVSVESVLSNLSPSMEIGATIFLSNSVMIISFLLINGFTNLLRGLKHLESPAK